VDIAPVIIQLPWLTSAWQTDGKSDDGEEDETQGVRLVGSGAMQRRAEWAEERKPRMPQHGLEDRLLNGHRGPLRSSQSFDKRLGDIQTSRYGQFPMSLVTAPSERQNQFQPRLWP
jgi:hypothetical protein